MDASVPRLADFTDAEKMAAEYAVRRIYPRGHLMQLVRPTLAPGVLSCAEVERLDDGAPVLVAGHPVAPRLQAVQEGAWQPGGADSGRNLALGRHFQYHRLRGADARSPQLMLMRVLQKTARMTSASSAPTI